LRYSDTLDLAATLHFFL